MDTDANRDLAEEARFALHGRILRCPLGGNPPDCPLYDVRKLSIAERIAWIESKNDDEAIDLYRQHNECLKCKVENRGS